MMSADARAYSRPGTALESSAQMPVFSLLFLALYFGMPIMPKREQALACLLLSISPQNFFYNVPEDCENDLS